MKLEENLSLERCPYCSIYRPNLPRVWQFETENHSGKNLRRWRAYKCGGCGGIVIASASDLGKNILEMFPERVMETFDFDYLRGDVLEDLKEALSCYSRGDYNAFAAMSRRTIQSIAKDLGADGKAKVLKQVNELKTIIEIEEETFKTIEEIIIAGHDGAHPYLPKLSPERAAILLELLKDVVYQLYVRKKKVEQSAELRKKAIEENKKADSAEQNQ